MVGFSGFKVNQMSSEDFFGYQFIVSQLELVRV